MAQFCLVGPSSQLPQLQLIALDLSLSAPRGAGPRLCSRIRCKVSAQVSAHSPSAAPPSSSHQLLQLWARCSSSQGPSQRVCPEPAAARADQDRALQLLGLHAMGAHVADVQPHRCAGVHPGGVHPPPCRHPSPHWAAHSSPHHHGHHPLPPGREEDVCLAG